MIKKMLPSLMPLATTDPNGLDPHSLFNLPDLPAPDGSDGQGLPDSSGPGPVDLSALPPFKTGAGIGGPPQALTLGRDFNYPATPTFTPHTAAPVRDDAGLSRRSRWAALLGTLGGSLLGGGLQGGLALGSSLASGLHRRADADYTHALQDWTRKNQTIDATNKQLETGYGNDVKQFNAQMAWDKVNDALRQQKATNERNGRLDTDRKQHDLNQEGQTWLDQLPKLTPDAQQEEITRASNDGRLERWGLSFPKNLDNNTWIYNGKSQATQTAEDAADARVTAADVRRGNQLDDQDRKQKTGQLNEYYKLLTDDRLDPKKAPAIANQIKGLESDLGLGGANVDLSKILMPMSPAQKASIAANLSRIGLSQEQFAFSRKMQIRSADRADRSQGIAEEGLTLRKQAAARSVQDKITKTGNDAEKVYRGNEHRRSQIAQAVTDTTRGISTVEWMMKGGSPGPDGKPPKPPTGAELAALQARKAAALNAIDTLKKEDKNLSDEQDYLAPNVPHLRAAKPGKPGAGGAGKPASGGQSVKVGGETFRVTVRKRGQ